MRPYAPYGAVLCLSLAYASAAAAEWASFTSHRFGTHIAYPADIFDQVQEGAATVHRFESEDGQAKFVVGGWLNSDSGTPATFKDMLSQQGERYASVTYAPKGRNWFVLSGYRGDMIYYEKIMYSCDRQLVNLYAITYPIAERRRYDRIVERMEDSFSPGRSCG